jgi:hypothetical protein
MAISYRIDAVRKIVYTTIKGETTEEQLERHSHTIGSDPEIDTSFVELVYVDPSSSASVTRSAIRKSAGTLSVYPPIEKIAIAASQDVTFGLARMFEMLADESPIEIRVFRGEAEARSWLGIE